MYKVLVSDSLSDEGIAILKKTPGVEVDVNTKLTPEELKAAIKNYHALVVRSATKATAEIIEAADNLKVIGRAGIGLDNVDAVAASKRGIVVMNTPGGNIVTTGEHAIAMMFSLARQTPQGNGLDEGRQVGKEQVHGRRDLQQDPRHHRNRPHRLDRCRSRPGIEDESDRLRSLHVSRSGRKARRHAGRPR